MFLANHYLPFGNIDRADNQQGEISHDSSGAYVARGKCVSIEK